MTTKDKEYIDRQHNQLNGRLATLEDRITVVESKTVATTDGSVKVELDKDHLREIISELLNKHKLVKENELNCLIDIYNDLVPALNRSHLNAEKRFELIRQGLMMLLKPNTANAAPSAPRNAEQDVASNALQNVEPKADTKEAPNLGQKHGIFSYAYYHNKSSCQFVTISMDIIVCDETGHSLPYSYIFPYFSSPSLPTSQ